MRYEIQTGLENKYSIINTEFEILSKKPVSNRYKESAKNIYLAYRGKIRVRNKELSGWHLPLRRGMSLVILGINRPKKNEKRVIAISR